MVEIKPIPRFVAIFVVAAVILVGAFVVTDGEFTLEALIMIAFIIAISAVLIVRVVAFILAIYRQRD